MSPVSLLKKAFMIFAVLVLLALATYISTPRYPLALEPLEQPSKAVVIVKGSTKPGAAVVIEGGRETVWAKAARDTGEFAIRVYLPEKRTILLRLMVKDIRGTIRRAEFIPLEWE